MLWTEENIIIQTKKIHGLEWRARNLPWLKTLTQYKLIGEVIFERNGSCYGFNYQGRFACLGKSDNDSKEARFFDRILRKAFDYSKPEGAYYNFVKEVILQLEIGDDFEIFSTKLRNERALRRKKYEEEHTFEGLDRFITRIANPTFERATGNSKKGTFDFIRVDVCIVTHWDKNRKEYIRENQEEITKRVLKKIEESVKFQKAGVPINFWKISSVTLTRDSILEYVFELKIK